MTERERDRARERRERDTHTDTHRNTQTHTDTHTHTHTHTHTPRRIRTHVFMSQSASQRAPRCSICASASNAYRKVLLGVGMPLGELVERVSLDTCHTKQQEPRAQRVNSARRKAANWPARSAPRERPACSAAALSPARQPRLHSRQHGSRAACRPGPRRAPAPPPVEHNRCDARRAARLASSQPQEDRWGAPDAQTPVPCHDAAAASAHTHRARSPTCRKT
jgi:hypothetical protein